MRQMDRSIRFAFIQPRRVFRTIQLLSRMEHHQQDNEHFPLKCTNAWCGWSFDSQGQHESRRQALVSIAAKIGRSAHALNAWVKWAEVVSGHPDGIPSEMVDRLKALER